MRDPHVSHVLVAQVVLVRCFDLGARLHVGPLEQAVRRHALYGHLADHSEQAEAHLGQVRVRVRDRVRARARVRAS